MKKDFTVRFSILIILVIILPLNLGSYTASANNSSRPANRDPLPTQNPQFVQSGQVFIPLVMVPPKDIPTVNAPFFNDEVQYAKTAVFWFGDVTLTDNYADVRVGYSPDELYVHVSVFDRRLWYDTDHSQNELTQWDAVSLFLNIDGNRGAAPDTNAYQFVGQLNWWEDDQDWKASYQGNGSDWEPNSIPFRIFSGWRGNAPNDNNNDRGWNMHFLIPFESFGLSDPPSEGEVWGMSLILHDRDDAQGTPIAKKIWPDSSNHIQPETWGKLRFGLPDYNPASTDVEGNTTIQHKLNGAAVMDAHVGGHTVCGQDYSPDFFDGWGEANYANYEQINIQNQSDVSDWPCFSKYYAKFPLDQIPPGKEIVSAAFTIYQFGNAGGGTWGIPPVSYIQVLTAMSDWDESTITWNNAPLAKENFEYIEVDPLSEFPDWPGVPRQWDVSQAVADAYANSKPLLLILYSADSAYHSGKYFISSDTGDWNQTGRPTLTVNWGE